MKITTTFHKKVPGPEEFSSLGYHIALEAEPPLEIQQDRELLADYARRLFAECRQRVEDELAREPRDRRLERRNGSSRFPGRPSSNGRQNGRRGASKGATASPKQVNYLRALANETGIGYRGLDDLAQDRFTKDLRDLTMREASKLIDELRA